MNAFLTPFAAAWQRFTCRVREARRMRRELAELSHMSAHELRDLGLSHAALAAASPSTSPCA